MEYQAVTDRLVKGALLRCKTCPFTLQKMPFYIAKGHLLLCKRASFIFRIGIYLTIIPYLPCFHWISIGIGYILFRIAKKPLRHSPILYNKV